MKRASRQPYGLSTVQSCKEAPEWRSVLERAFAEQVENFKQQIERGGLPFGELLDAREIDVLLDELGVTFRERVYTPEVVVRMFLFQALSEDGSCRNAVSKLIAERLAQRHGTLFTEHGQLLCGPRGFRKNCCGGWRGGWDSGWRVKRTQAWLWQGRVVKIVDGTVVSMPDTPENQDAFPQHTTQRPGLGFPLARLVVVFSLAVGTVVDMALGSYQGKQSGENTLFRSLWDGALDAGDVLTGDRCYCSYVDIALLAERKVDVVFRKHQLRSSDFRRGRRLGKHDHLVTWHKPAQRPKWMDAEAFARLPDEVTLREVRVIVADKGLRVRNLIIVTTLLSPQAYSKEEIAELYRQRWHAELDLRSIKSTLKMDVLRTETPAMVRKEAWTYLLAYNLIRLKIAQAAACTGLTPRQISFKGAVTAARRLCLIRPAVQCHDRSRVAGYDCVSSSRRSPQPLRTTGRQTSTPMHCLPHRTTPHRPIPRREKDFCLIKCHSFLAPFMSWRGDASLLRHCCGTGQET